MLDNTKSAIYTMYSTKRSAQGAGSIKRGHDPADTGAAALGGAGSDGCRTAAAVRGLT